MDERFKSKLVPIRWDVLHEKLALANITKGDLARRYNFYRTTIRYWERVGKLPGKILEAICEDLKIDIHEILPIRKAAPQTLEERKKIILNRFSFHDVDVKGTEAIKQIKKLTLELALQIEEICPPSPEKRHALTLLKGVQFYSHSSICQEHPMSEI